jgi:hypothetical protein
MTIPSATKNNMLNGQTFTLASLHTAFPGTTGANEVSGGAPAYAQKAITVNAASGGTRLLNAAVTFDVPATTVRWVGFYNAGVFIGCAPNGGATPFNFMAVPSSDLVYAVAHGLVNGTKITFFNGTPPAPLVEGTVYFVVTSTTDTFQVAATLAGAAIDITAAATFGCVVCAITEDVYAAQGTHQLTAATVTIPD